MADRLATGDWDEYANGEFFTLVGERMNDWLDCLDAIEARADIQPVSAPADDD
jgi:hypothetical protein